MTRQFQLPLAWLTIGLMLLASACDDRGKEEKTQVTENNQYIRETTCRTNGDFFLIREKLEGQPGMRHRFGITVSDKSFSYDGEGFSKYANDMEQIETIVLSSKSIEVSVNPDISRRKKPYVFVDPRPECVEGFVAFLRKLKNGKVDENQGVYTFTWL